VIQVRVAHEGTRTQIEIRTGNSPGQLHTAGNLNIDTFNAEVLLACLAGHYDIEVIEV
jgi:hypothetical protein